MPIRRFAGSIWAKPSAWVETGGEPSRSPVLRAPVDRNDWLSPNEGMAGQERPAEEARGAAVASSDAPGKRKDGPTMRYQISGKQIDVGEALTTHVKTELGETIDK